MESVASANTNFSLDLFKKLSADNRTGNVFFSPLSISSALAMVYLGARGNTATEMAQVLRFVKSEMTKADGHLHLQQQTQNVQVPKFLQKQKKTAHFSKAGDDLHVGFSKLISELNKAGAPYKLSMANRLYGEKSFNFVEQYIAETRKHYHAELESVDFITGAEAARQNINAWVEKQTQGKTFRNQRTYCIITTVSWSGVLSLKLERELTYGKLMEWTKPDMMDVEEVEVSLPKFKFEETYDLKEVLKSMGMVDAFDRGRSDFSGMSSGSELFLSKVVHKSFVEVNEEGTEAAAATAAIMMMRCAMISARFTANHPFLFFIRHNKSQNILFYGRFCSP
nr:PREDICTED: serpin B10-like [Lepisosteus oculatus]